MSRELIDPARFKSELIKNGARVSLRLRVDAKYFDPKRVSIAFLRDKMSLIEPLRNAKAEASRRLMS